jgi:hypothetical protein
MEAELRRELTKLAGTQLIELAAQSGVWELLVFFFEFTGKSEGKLICWR